MTTESTAGAALVQRVQALGWPEIGRSSQGRAIVARDWPGGGGGEAASSQGPAQGPLVLMGGIHGNEPASVEAVMDLLECGTLTGSPPSPHALWAGAGLVPGLLGARRLWVVPALNPDGLLADCKDSARGVDLNRNFPARNFECAHPPGYDPGPAPLSEPESAAFAALVDAVGPCAVVAVHAPFACINHDGPAGAWAAEVADACGWPARADIGYPTPGSLGSWLGVDRGLPVLTIELPPGPYAPFRQPARQALAAALRFWRLD